MSSAVADERTATRLRAELLIGLERSRAATSPAARPCGRAPACCATQLRAPADRRGRPRSIAHELGADVASLHRVEVRVGDDHEPRRDGETGAGQLTEVRALATSAVDVGERQIVKPRDFLRHGILPYWRSGRRNRRQRRSPVRSRNWSGSSTAIRRCRRSLRVCPDVRSARCGSWPGRLRPRPAVKRVIISVSITPGHTALTRTPCVAYSSAAVLVSPESRASTRCRRGIAAKPTSPATDEILTIEPPPRLEHSRDLGAHRRTHR